MILMGVHAPLVSRRVVYVLVERLCGCDTLVHSWPTPNGLASEATELLKIVASGRPELHRHHPRTQLRIEPLRRPR